MTKEQYFQDVQQQNFGRVLYSMYQEKFDHNKHKPFLQPREFMMYMQMSGMLNTYLERAFQHYEQKFEITKLYDKNGKLIRFV